MKTKHLTPFILLAPLALVLALNSCGGGSDNDSDGGIPAELTQSLTYDEVAPQKPAGGYRIYLDASGSMNGYFSRGLTDYISIVTGIKDSDPDSKVFFWGAANQDKEIADLNSTITNGNYKAASSLLPEILCKMRQDVANDSVLVFLVTDGIVSNSKIVTGSRSGYTINDLPLIPGKIEQSLRDSANTPIAVGLFRFELPFMGRYWDIDNHPVDLPGKNDDMETVDRPLYVFALGSPAAITDFKQKLDNKEYHQIDGFRNRMKKSLYMGHLQRREGLNPFKESGEGDNTFTLNEEETAILLPAEVDEFEIKADVPRWIEADGIDPGQGTLSVVNSANRELPKISSRYNANNATINVFTREGCEINPGDYTLTYTIVSRPSQAWTEYSCNDDREISSTFLTEKTFGLAEVIQGLERATNHPETIYQSGFSFTKE